MNLVFRPSRSDVMKVAMGLSPWIQTITNFRVAERRLTSSYGRRNVALLKSPCDTPPMDLCARDQTSAKRSHIRRSRRDGLLPKSPERGSVTRSTLKCQCLRCCLRLTKPNFPGFALGQPAREESLNSQRCLTHLGQPNCANPLPSARSVQECGGPPPLFTGHRTAMKVRVSSFSHGERRRSLKPPITLPAQPTVPCRPGALTERCERPRASSSKLLP